MTYSQNTTLQKPKQLEILKTVSGQELKMMMSEFSTQQRTAAQNESAKEQSLDDDFFNLNQPSGARQELFDNYDVFYREQAQLESSQSLLSRQESPAKIQVRAIETKNGARKLKISNFMPKSPEASPVKQQTAVWQADDITVAIQDKASHSELSENALRTSLPSQIHYTHDQKENQEDLRLSATAQSDPLYVGLGQEGEASAQNQILSSRLRNGLFSPPIRTKLC